MIYLWKKGRYTDWITLHLFDKVSSRYIRLAAFCRRRFHRRGNCNSKNVFSSAWILHETDSIIYYEHQKHVMCIEDHYIKSINSSGVFWLQELGYLTRYNSGSFGFLRRSVVDVPSTTKRYHSYGDVAFFLTFLHKFVDEFTLNVKLVEHWPANVLYSLEGFILLIVIKAFRNYSHSVLFTFYLNASQLA